MMRTRVELENAVFGKPSAEDDVASELWLLDHEVRKEPEHERRVKLLATLSDLYDIQNPVGNWELDIGEDIGAGEVPGVTAAALRELAEDIEALADFAEDAESRRRGPPPSIN